MKRNCISKKVKYKYNIQVLQVSIFTIDYNFKSFLTRRTKAIDMVNKTCEFQGFTIALASIVILVGLSPLSYGQQNISQSKHQFNSDWPNIHSNVVTSFNSNVSFPSIADSAYIHPFAIVIGNCYIGEMVMVAPTAVCRGDEGTPLYVGEFSNIQDGVIIHGLITTLNGKNLDDRRFSNNGDLLQGNDSRFDSGYSVYIGKNVSLAHDSMVHGPAWIGNNTFVGMKSIIFNAKVGSNVAIGISSTITGGVSIPDNKFVPPGSVITTQKQADNLPNRIGSEYENINSYVVPVNKELAAGYSENKSNISSVEDRENTMEMGMMETGLPSPN